MSLRGERGIMRAIDFKMDLQREPNVAGERVNIQMSIGQFESCT